MLLVALAMIPAAVFVGYASAQDQQQLQQRAADDTMRLAKLAAADKARNVDNARGVLVVVSRLPEASGTDVDACRLRLAELLSQYPEYANLGLAEPDGTLRCAAKASSTPVTFAPTAWFQRTVAALSFAVGNYEMDIVTGQPVLYVGYPLLDAEAHVERVAFVAFDLARLNADPLPSPLPPGAVLQVVDESGRVLLRYPEPESWVGLTVPEASLVDAVRIQSEGTLEVKGPDGATRLFAFTTLGPALALSRLGVLVGVPTHDLVVEGQLHLVRNFAALSVASLMAFGSAWFLGDRFIVRQLRATEKTTQRLREGDLSARTGVEEASSEVGHLAQTVDEMAAALERQQRELERAQEDLRRLNGELEQRVRSRTVALEVANRELEAFNYTVSHDLRTPLRTINGFAQVLLEEYGNRLDEEGKQALERVRAASDRMSELIRDLLEFSRITRTQLKLQEVDLATLARSVADQLSQREPERTVSFTAPEYVRATCDPRLLRVTLENLLGNAWKFSRLRADARVEFGIEPGPDGPVFFVRDNGAGFEMAYAQKLFRPFERLHSEGQFEGTGIGLATVARIVERHGGRVWAEGAVGQGACFRFTLGDPSAPKLW